jgi:hypothetical protein
MTRKLFIVAADNVADYRSLERAVGGEPDVTVIYDRRHHSTGPPDEKRRRRTDVDEQLRSKARPLSDSAGRRRSRVEPLARQSTAQCGARSERTPHRVLTKLAVSANSESVGFRL